MSARGPAYLLARVGHRQGLAVWPVADHGIHRIRKGKDSRAKRNLLAAQSSRITGAVKKFLVRKHNLRRIAQKRNLGEHVVPDFAVGTHDRLFVVVNRPWFATNTIGT